MPIKNTFHNDAIQFPRLLAEISACCDVPTEDFVALKESMDLDGAKINMIFDRAQKVFERNKSWICPAPSDKPGLAFIQTLEAKIDELEFMLRFQESAPWKFSEKELVRLEAEYDRLGTVASDLRMIYDQ